MKPAETAATPSGSCWRRSLSSALAIAGPLLLVLAIHGQSVYRSPAFGQLADQAYHLAALEAFDEAWGAGEFPPSWDASANGGRGAPTFVLYPPFFAFLGALGMRAGLGGVEALRVSFLLSAAALFGAALYLAAGRAPLARAAWTAAAACLLPGATFQGLARGMFPGFLALAWMALLLGALDRLANGDRHWRTQVTLTLAAAGLILTHTLTAYMLLALLLAAAPWTARALGLAGLRGAGGAAALALLLTAWFWVPMLQTAPHVQAEYLTEAHPYAESLLFTPAEPRTALERQWDEINAIGGFVSWAQLMLAGALAWSLRGTDQPISIRILPTALALVCAVSFHPVGAWLAAVLPGLDQVQFAWRWQGPLAVLCGAALARLPPGRRAAPGSLAGIVVVAFLPLGQPSKRPWLTAERPEKTYELAAFAEVEPAERAAYLHNRVEMRPRGADRRLYPPGPNGRWETLDGTAEVAAELLSPSLRVYRISAGAPVRLRLHTYQLPGWRACLDGRPVTIQAEPGTALQLLSLPAGELRLELRFDRLLLH